MFAEKHSQRSDQEEQAEQIENKMKALHQSDTAQDHDSAHDKGTDNPPDEDAMLRARRHAKISKNQHKNEDVIDAQ